LDYLRNRSFPRSRPIAACAAAVLLEDGHAGQVCPLSGPELLSARGRAALIGKELGREIGVAEITADVARQRMIQAPLRV
jgi:uncharacterized protein YbjT (DUF2867 family)